MTRRWIVAAGLVAVAGSTAGAQQPSLAEVLRRAGAYVADFEHRLAGIVAEERYVQEEPSPPGLVDPIRRELRSDLLLVKPDGGHDWLQFRDVFEVDGVAVRDRGDRLTRLFLEPAASTRDRMRSIVNESARFNVGSIARTINVPVLALLFLDPANQSRFRFKRARNRQPEAARDAASSGHFRAATEIWAVAFEETERPTFIRTTSLRDMRAKGHFWIEPSSGRVFMTELIVQGKGLRAVIDVSYQSEPLVGFLVPIAMHERYEGRGTRVVADATYGRFRQFQVDVNATFKK